MSRLRLPAAVSHPVRLLPLSFLALTLVGTVLLLVPVMTTGSGSADLVDALFTATSAVTVTGLATVDTSAYWTPAGQAVILALVQVGGLGIVAISTVLGLFIGGRLGLRTRLVAQTEMHVVNIGEVRPLFRRVAVIMIGFQLAIAAILTVRYRADYFDTWADALWHGYFDAVMAFNNAGFSLNADSLTTYAGDGLIILPICLGVFIGAMGFPVLAELFKNWRTPDQWTIHTRLTVWGSLFLLAVGAVAFIALEWTNPATIGGLPWQERVISGIEGSVMPRSGGLNSFDWGATRGETLSMGTVLMFIGGGSASTAGGIKVTTFLLLGFVILAEVRGDPDVSIGNRSIGAPVMRTALSIALISVMLVTSTTWLLMLLTEFNFEDVLFETTSAFATAGLSTGITPDLPHSAKLVLAALMFIGRVGTITAASAFVLRRRVTRYHLPEEQPIIG